MNPKIFAAVVFSTLFPLGAAFADCPTGTCGTGETLKLNFYASGTIPVNATGTVVAKITVDGKTVSSPSTVPGVSTATTTTGTADIVPETIYGGIVETTSTGTLTSSATTMTSYFEVESGCGWTFHTRSKKSTVSGWEGIEWKEASACTTDTDAFSGTQQDFQIRLVKKAATSNPTSGDNQPDSGVSPAGGGAGEGFPGVATPPSIPETYQDVAPPPPGSAPVTTTPARHSWTVRLGITATTTARKLPPRIVKTRSARRFPSSAPATPMTASATA